MLHYPWRSLCIPVSDASAAPIERSTPLHAAELLLVRSRVSSYMIRHARGPGALRRVDVQA